MANSIIIYSPIGHGENRKIDTIVALFKLESTADLPTDETLTLEAVDVLYLTNCPKFADRTQHRGMSVVPYDVAITATRFGHMNASIAAKLSRARIEISEESILKRNNPMLSVGPDGKVSLFQSQPSTSKDVKATNPKDSIGIRKWRQFATLPWVALAHVAAAFGEGMAKYGKFNWRVIGVKSSVYFDASIGHMMAWYEGENIDKDSGLSHLAKAAASILILLDAECNGTLNDDRPPKANLDQTRDDLQKVIDDLFDKYPEFKQPFTEKDS